MQSFGTATCLKSEITQRVALSCIIYSVLVYSVSLSLYWFWTMLYKNSANVKMKKKEYMLETSSSRTRMTATCKTMLTSSGEVWRENLGDGFMRKTHIQPKWVCMKTNIYLESTSYEELYKQINILIYYTLSQRHYVRNTRNTVISFREVVDTFSCWGMIQNILNNHDTSKKN